MTWIRIAALLGLAAVFHILFLGVGPGFDRLIARPAVSVLFLVALVLGLGVPLLLVARRPDAREEDRGRVSWRVLSGVVVAHLLAVLAIGTLVTGWSPLTDDEQAYVLQAHNLLSGVATSPALLPAGGWGNPFILEIEGPGGVLHWTGCYPFLAGALTAPGLIFGAPNLLWALLGVPIVWQVTRLAEDIWPRADGLLIACMVAGSPFLIGMGVSKHLAVPAALWSVLVVRGLIHGTRHGPGWVDAGVGLCFGLLVHTRPLEAALVAAIVAVFLLVRTVRDWRSGLLGGVLVAAGGLLPFLGWLAYNHAVTGHMTQMPYSLLAVDGPVMGFGQVYNGTHTVLTGVRMRLYGLIELASWGLAGPLLVVLVLEAIRRGRADWRIAVVAAALVIHVLVYLPAPFAAVRTVGPTYRLWMVPGLALILAGVTAADSTSWRDRTWLMMAFGWMTAMPYLLARASVATLVYATPDAAVAQAELEEPALVFSEHAMHTSQAEVFCCYAPLPREADPAVLWIQAESDRDAVRAAYPGRSEYRLTWTPEGPRVEPLPATSSP